MIINAAEKLVSSSLNYVFLNDRTVDSAKSKFNELQKDGIIKDGVKFDDAVWYTTDEYSNVGLHFRFNEFSYARWYQPLVGLDFVTFVSHVKCFLTSLFGGRALVTMQDVLCDLRHLIETDPSNVVGMTDTLSLTRPWICEEFFALLSSSLGGIDELDRVGAAMDAYAEINYKGESRNRRTLAEFDTYFRFDEILKEFWNSPLSREERLFFYSHF